MKIYLVDVDETLEISNGPVTIGSLVDLWNQGHIIGICGNWGMVVQRVINWHHLFSIMNIGIDKVNYMMAIKMNIRADDYIMIGNTAGGNSPDDQLSAKTAGWRFIKESDFAKGIR